MNRYEDSALITRDWLILIGMGETPSDMGEDYEPHYKKERLNIWEYNGTGEWIFDSCDAISVRTRGELRCLAALLKVNLNAVE
jgi:hypothetical protein